MEKLKVQGFRMSRVHFSVAWIIIFSICILLLSAESTLANESDFSATSNKNNQANLMDMQMPVMDGSRASCEIRKLPQYENVPIIALTTNAMEGDREKVFVAGMKDFISKPMNEDEMFSTIAKWALPDKPMGDIHTRFAERV